MERFPDRFFNAGVAEQNMVGMATGLAEAGFTPYVYSISTFASMRPYEFIRNGPVFHSLPVRVVGIGEGLDYGHNGMTHYALEDMALMRAQPGLRRDRARRLRPSSPCTAKRCRSCPAQPTSGLASNPSRCPDLTVDSRSVGRSNSARATMS